MVTSDERCPGSKPLVVATGAAGVDFGGGCLGSFPEELELCGAVYRGGVVNYRFAHTRSWGGVGSFDVRRSLTNCYG